MRLLLKDHAELFLNKLCSAYIVLKRFDSVVYHASGIYSLKTLNK